MPPPGATKRKRGDRGYSGDDFQRPSPYRPGNLNLAHQQPSNYGRDYPDYRGRGGRRSSRGGRNGPYTSSPTTARPRDIPTGPRQDSSQNRPAPDPGATDVQMSTERVDDLEITSPPHDSTFFRYEFLTESVRADWSSAGQEDIHAKALEAVNNEDEMALSTLMQELVQATLSAQIPAEDAAAVVKQVIEAAGDDTRDVEDHIYPNLAKACFLDTLCIVLESGTNSSMARLQQLILAAGISQDLLRQELDAALLEKFGLIRSTFGRMAIRKQTNILYRQANFNLLREESEGFAKLMTELFTTSGSEPPNGDVVASTVERVKAMIGAFDLDVGRSLDVVLDVFGAVLVKQFRFFVKFLRASPWWPRDFGAVGDDAQNLFSGVPLWVLPGTFDWQNTDDQKAYVAQRTHVRDKDFWERARQLGSQAYYNLEHQPASEIERALASAESDGRNMDDLWIRETGVRPRNGNKDAAQLLGFKLRFYSSSNARDENEMLPDNLIYLSALLIKIGFISLADLYPHIWRSDDEMEELRQQRLIEKAERERVARPGTNSRNALLMAGALADDTLPVPTRLRDSSTRAGTPSKEAEPEKKTMKDHIPEISDQKVLLLKSLLAIGALPEALFILGRFPWLIDLYPEIPEYFNRILHHALNQVYAPLQPMGERRSLELPKPSADTEVPGVPKGQVRLTETSIAKVLRWALLDRMDSSDGTSYRFYWDEWNDNIPVCQTIDDVFTLCGTFLGLVGIKVGQDPALLLKFARIGRHSLQQDKSETNHRRWLDLSKRILLPALSLTKSNAGVVNEVFALISCFTINTRFLMYLEWTSGRTSRNPDIKFATDQAKAETKDVLKRISKTNVRPMARALARIAYANPHIVITTAIAQIEVYDSIADVFVEGARYFTDLGYDVLTWAMISSMSREGRSRTRQGGLFTSKWLSAMASFAGKLFKRYNIMKPGPILQYVEAQLTHGNSTDLIMLEQLISSMAGIASDISFNDAQLQAMGGGELLRSQTLLQVLDRRHDSRTSAKRLMRSLRESGLTGSLLISLAQQRQACIYENEYTAAPLKLLGMVFDDIHQVMVQYLELLRSNFTFDDFSSCIPNLADLLLRYQLQPEVAFWISRPLIAHHIAETDKLEAERKKSDDASGKELANDDVDMADDINGVEDHEEGEEFEIESLTVETATPTPAEISGSAMEVESDEKSDTTALPDARHDRWHPVLEEIMHAITPQLPETVRLIIGTGFYCTFWQLSLYDIVVPGKSYEDEVSRHQKKVTAITGDRTDVSIAGTRKREAEKKERQALVDRILAENKQHIKACNESKARLSQEKDQWFAGKARIYEQLNSALMEHCFLPRLLFSPLDAYFCFKFIKFLHSVGTPNFRTLGLYDLFLEQKRLTSLIFTCTAKEADNLGRFLAEVFRDLGRWHQNKTVYEREAFGLKKHLPGFAMKLEGGKPATFLGFEEFRRILYKWHHNTYLAMTNCLSSSEYMHIRNAISVLRSISLQFPAVNWHGAKLIELLKKLGDDASKEDLQLASKAVMGALHRREKAWVIPQAFRKGPEKPETKSDMKTEAPGDDPTHSDKSIESKAVPAASDAPKVEAQTEATEVKVESSDSTVVASKVASAATLLAETMTSKAPAAQTNGVKPVGSTESRESPLASPQPVDLPKRVMPSPAPWPLSARPATLPARPESNDGRTTHRDVRGHPRPPSGHEFRPPVDSRSGSSRHNRPDERHDYNRAPSRARERDSGRPHREEYPSRDERDQRHPDERSRPQDSSLGPRPLRSRNEDVRNERPPLSEAVLPTSALVPQSEPVAINPARAALIEQGQNISIRGQAQERSSRLSKPSSPSRSDDHRGPRNDLDRPSRGPDSQRNDPPPRLERTGYEPRQSGRQIDMQHGRLEQDFSHPHSERNESDVPSGPRGRGAPSRTVPPVNTQPAERPPPTGPARPHTRSNSHAEPSTPAPDAPGVHPDRLRQIAPSPTEQRSQPHLPMSIQTSPPLGPRGNSHAPVGAPSGPSPTTRGPPSGPQNPNEISVRGRRNPLNTVNSTLQQATGPPARGRGGRQSAGPVTTHAQPVNGHSAPPDGRDLFAQSTNGPPNLRERAPLKREEGPPPKISPDRAGRDARFDRVHDLGRPEEPRRSGRREDDDMARNERLAREDPTRKHPRSEEGYNRVARMPSDPKRSRRGG